MSACCSLTDSTLNAQSYQTAATNRTLYTAMCVNCVDYIKPT